MLRKMSVLVSLMLVVAILFSACAPQEAAPVEEAPAEEAPAPAAGPVVNLRIGVASDMSPPIIKVIEDAIKKWNADNPSIQVVVEVTPEYWVKIPSAFAAGTAPDIIYNTITETTSTFGEIGMYLPLDDYISASSAVNPEDFVEAIWNAGVWNGSTWVVPYNWSNIGIVYNKAMFDAAGLDYPKAGWNWDEFLTTAQTLTKAPDQYGFYVDKWPYYGLFPFILSNGAQILSADKSRVIADSPEGLEAIKFYIDLVREYKVAPTAPELGENPDPFATKVVAMQLVPSWKPATYAETAPDLEYGVTSIPMKAKRVNYFEGAGFGINAKSAYADEAWKVLEFLTSDVHQKEMANLQIYFPSRESTLDAIQWDEARKAFLAEIPYGLDLQVVSQWESLTSNWYFWLEGAVGGVDPIDIPVDVANVIAACNAELDKHPVK